MSRLDPVTHTLGIPAVDDLGATGITMASPGTPSSPSRIHPHSLPRSVPCPFRPQPGLPPSLHRLHNAYHYDHHLLLKEMALPRAFRPYPPVTSKERA